jgi:cellulose synthase/poly-beta-1,6-N-acetylglucosamine synthase-like glycosyltransferase
MLNVVFEVIFWASLFFISYTYFLYPVALVFLQILFKKNEVLSGNLPDISVIVSVYNEESIIEQKIDNFFSVNYPAAKIELLVGSDGSTDNTNVILLSKKGQIKSVIYSERRGKIAVLTDLVKLAKGEIVIFNDANTMMHPDAVMYLAGHFSDRAVGCVCGKLLLRVMNRDGNASNCEGLYWKYENFLKELEGRMGCLLGANGGLYAIRKSLYPVVPGDVIVDDFWISMDVLFNNHDVRFETRSIGHEDVSDSVHSEMKRKIRIGAGNYQFFFRNKQWLRLNVGLKGFFYWSHKVIRWYVPFLLIAVFFSNLMLLSEHWFRLIFSSQIIFYFLCFSGWILNAMRFKAGFFNVFYYFYLMNYSLFLGFFRFLSNTQRVTWDRGR